MSTEITESNKNQAPSPGAPAEQEAIASLSLMAVLADRTMAGEERAKLTEIMAGLTEESRKKIYEKVFQGNTSIEEELKQLDSEVVLAKAYTLVSTICMSDGVFSKKEREFLARLRTSIFCRLGEE